MRLMVKKIWLMVLIGLLLVACSSDEESSSNSTEIPTAEPTTVSDEDPFYAPDFTLNQIEGSPLTLSELQGQWVILNFWATWCKPCVEEMPALQHIADNYAERGLVVLGVNVREDDDLVKTFLAENEITYPIVMTPRGEAEDQVLLDYMASALPQTFIIDPSGEILWRAFSELDLEDFTLLLENFMTAEEASG